MPISACSLRVLTFFVWGEILPPFQTVNDVGTRECSWSDIKFPLFLQVSCVLLVPTVFTDRQRTEAGGLGLHFTSPSISPQLPGPPLKTSEEFVGFNKMVASDSKNCTSCKSDYTNRQTWFTSKSTRSRK